MQLVFVGDERSRWFRIPQQAGVPMQRFIEKDKASLDDVITAMNNNLTDEDDCAIVFSLIFDLITMKKSPYLPPNAPELFTVNSLIDMNTIFEQISNAMQDWSQRFPNLKVIWVLPHPVNFVQYNQILISNAGLNVNLQEQSNLAVQLERDAKILFSRINHLKTMWRERLQYPFIHLSEIFFSKSRCGDTFAMNSEKIMWPKGYTVDGIHPSVKLTKSFGNTLWRWMTIIGIKPLEIAQRKNYTKVSLLILLIDF